MLFDFACFCTVYAENEHVDKDVGELIMLTQPFFLFNDVVKKGLPSLRSSLEKED
jgi:hypothetical protein